MACALSICGHHPQMPREAGGRKYVQYSVDVRILSYSADEDAAANNTTPPDDASGGAALVDKWKVNRRFSQFVELHQELEARHAAALQRCGAQLPSKFRLPSSLQAEGDERAPPARALALPGLPPPEQ